MSRIFDDLLRHDVDQSQYHHFPRRAREGAKAVVMPA
jgi:hypothetical protein